MPGTSPAKLGAVRMLIAAVPEGALRSLETALASAKDAAMVEIRDLIRAERADRGLRDQVLSPLLPLAMARPEAIPGPVLAPGLLSAIWAAAKRRNGPLIEKAARARGELRHDDPEPVEYDRLCIEIAGMLRGEGALAPAGLDPKLAAEAAQLVDLTPLARQAIRRAPEWLGRVSEESAATLKLIFKDATAIAQDATPRLLDIIMAHLSEPQQIMRLIAVLTDRSGDRFLASSELASFGERLLADVDRRIARMKAFDMQAGSAAAVSMARDIVVSTTILNELEQQVELSKDGPWGARVSAARRNMAAAVEARLRDAESEVAKALPLQNVKIAGRMTRHAPKLAADPDMRVVERARALVTLVGEVRSVAAGGGYGALRSQVAERLTERLNVYADEVLHAINAGETPDEARALAYLEIAAEFLGHVRDEETAQIVRRRAAVAGGRASSASQDAA